MTLCLYNTLTHKKEQFKPLDPDHVRFYVCGPTVYDFAHIGNARPVVVFDMLYRILRYQYPQVTYVRNITDVDDKINKAVKETNETIQQLTERTTKVYHADMRALNAASPDLEPRATQHIPEMIEMIETLVKRGHAYCAEGHVLFSVQTYKGYGKLSRCNQDELISGARVDVAPYKKDPGDFVLWKPSDKETPGWDSPWGRGRPGWHLECSAMSARYLGETFDIHGGGNDLVFPHHENEIAQSCCTYQTDFMAKIWMHNGHLTLDRQKMSKSEGNFFTVRDLLAQYDGETIRFALLSAHYRQPLDWTDGVLQQSKQALDRFYTALKECFDTPCAPEDLDPDFLSALTDDLNTPLAITALHRLVSEVNTTKGMEKEKLAKSLKASGRFLGILLQDPMAWFHGAESKTGLSESEIEQLIEKRRNARQEKNFAESDRIRDQLDESGIVLEDKAGQTTWRRR